MSDPVQMALIAGLVAVVPSVLAYLSVIRQTRNHQDVTNQIEVVRKDVNGKMQQLLKVTGEAEKAKGKIEGIAEAGREESERHG